MENNTHIVSGAFYIARQIFESELWLNKPSTWKVIWIYIIGNVNHAKNEKFERGEGFFNFSRSLKDIGNDITEDMVKHFCQYGRRMKMLSTKRSTRGIIINVLNYDKYQTLGNYISTTIGTSKARAKHEQSTTINKKSKNDKKTTTTNNISLIREIVQAPASFGNKDINKVISFLKEKLGGSLDGPAQQNRNFANLLIKRFKKDYPEKDPADLICQLIEFGLKDSFHSKNITSFKYLYYNAQKIIQSVKSKITNPKYIKL